MSAIDKEPFPRVALFAAGALVVFSLVVTAAGRFARVSAPTGIAASAPSAGPARSIDLRFADEATGSVTVRDSRDGRLVASLAPGTNGFIRGVMRGLARDRKSRGIGPARPFRLSEGRAGDLTIEDTATGRRIDLDAFGSSNKGAFSALLPDRGAS